MLHKRNQLIIGILLNLVCYMAFSPFAVEAAPPKVGLQPIVANGFGNTFFDRETVRYIKDPYKDAFILEVWIKADDNNANGGYNLTRYYIRLEPRQYQQMKSIDYDSNAKVIEQNSFTYSENRWKEIIPGSLADAWYHQVIQYARESKIITKRGARD